MLELAIWLYHIGTPDLTVRIATDAATVIFLLWGILNYYEKKKLRRHFVRCPDQLDTGRWYRNTDGVR